MSNLYWYTSTFAQLHPISRIKIVSNGFFLVEEKVLLPNYQQLIFKKGDQLIQVILYESEILERTYLFVQECEVKEKFIHNLQTKEFTTLCHDMFITDDEPQKMIDQIQASLKEYESESDEDDESEFLHIYGQQMWHDDAFIVGNRAALLRLRDTIDQALAYGEKREGFSPIDYECFNLYVTCVENDFNWEQLDAPYHDPEIFEKRKRPIEAFKQYKIME